MLKASDLERDPYLRVLLMGPPKCGKTSTCVATSPGPVAVLLCEADSALRGAKRHSPSADHFGFIRVKGWNSMMKGLEEVKEAIKEDGVKTVIVDPLSDFAAELEAECLMATDNGRGPDGRRAYPEYNKRLRHLLERLFALKAHLIVISHYIEVGGGEVQPEGGGSPTPREGEGIVPLLAGKARALVSAKFTDVIWMDIRRDGPKETGGRVFVTAPQGVWGPGCRSLDGSTVLPANITKLIEVFDLVEKKERSKRS
jgi:hypothetical protein